MDRERFQRVKEIFLAACDLPEHERDDYIAKACDHDAALIADVKQQLDFDATPHEALTQQGASEVIESLLESTDDAHEDPKQIGQYRVVRCIGRGGMGVIYETVQEQPNRRVAVKLVRADVTSSASRRRFEAEAEMLARLQHRGIAQIFDAGIANVTYTDGVRRQPYLAMELIDGAELRETASRLDRDAIIDLMIEVCDAVHHAHQRGVIHRDLKPSNVLIDPDGQPKVLDFGVARSVDRDATLTSDPHAIIGTLAYMSPEQARGEAGDASVDTRTDVYSVGVMLYEALTGELPIDVRNDGLAEALDRIGRETPPLMGTCDPRLRGDLSTILARSLEKEPERRYPSAHALAEDLRRFQRFEPIAARPASSIYQLRRFARRHRPLVTGIAVATAALLVGTGVAIREATRANRALDRVEIERDGAVAVRDFLAEDLLALSDPTVEPNRDLPLRTALDRAAETLPDRFDDRPWIRGVLLSTVGRAYHGLGMFAEAETLLEDAVVLLDDAFGPNDEQTLLARSTLAMSLQRQGRLDEAEDAERAILDIHETLHGATHQATITTKSRLATILIGQGRYQEAKELLQRIRDDASTHLGETHTVYLTSLGELAQLEALAGDFDTAVSLYEQVLEGRRESLGEDHPHTMIALDGIADARWRSGQPNEAAAILEENLERRRRVLSDTHTATLVNMSSLALAYADTNRLDEAQEMLEQCLVIREGRDGAEHPLTLGCQNNLALIHFRRQDYERALTMFQACAQTRSRVLGPGHANTINAWINTANSMSRLERYDEAVGIAEQAMAAAKESLEPTSHFNGLLLAIRGSALSKLGQIDTARESLAESVAILEASLGPEHPQTRGIAGLLAGLADAE